MIAFIFYHVVYYMFMYLPYITYLVLTLCKQALSPQKKGFKLSSLSTQLRLTAALRLLGASIQRSDSSH